MKNVQICQQVFSKSNEIRLLIDDDDKKAQAAGKAAA